MRSGSRTVLSNCLMSALDRIAVLISLEGGVASQVLGSAPDVRGRHRSGRICPFVFAELAILSAAASCTAKLGIRGTT